MSSIHFIQGNHWHPPPSRALLLPLLFFLRHCLPWPSCPTVLHRPCIVSGTLGSVLAAVRHFLRTGSSPGQLPMWCCRPLLTTLGKASPPNLGHRAGLRSPQESDHLPRSVSPRIWDQDSGDPVLVFHFLLPLPPLGGCLPTPPPDGRPALKVQPKHLLFLQPSLIALGDPELVFLGVRPPHPEVQPSGICSQCRLPLAPGDRKLFVMFVR